MRLLSAALAAVLLAASTAAAAPQPASPPPGPAAGPPTGLALGAALARGEIDPSAYDFGALRYAPSRTLLFLAAQTGAQTAVAAAHGKASWPAVVAAHACLTPAEQMTMAGFDSALLAPDAADWGQEKAAAEAAFARYAAARDAVLAGQPSPEPEFAAEAAEAAEAARAAQAKSPELQALYRHRAADQLWRHALVFGAKRPYAAGLGKAGTVWLNARLTTDGCAADLAAAAWLRQVLGRIAWFDLKTYGKDADQAAWLIAEHADADPQTQLLVLNRMGVAVLDKQTNPANFASLWDRVALNAGRPQRYGTQMRCAGGTWAPTAPVEDPAKLDERRRWVGLGPEADFARKGGKVCGG